MSNSAIILPFPQRATGRREVLKMKRERQEWEYETIIVVAALGLLALSLILYGVFVAP